MAGNKALNKANKAKEDEFYTQISDIEKELKHYKEHFKGKTVFCNCDDPETSNFWRYFQLNFGVLELEKLVSTHYEKDKPSYKLEYSYLPDEKGQYTLQVIQTKLKQNGDFRSLECIEILKEADIIVTNPPFSLFREYVAQLIEYDKKFIIIGSQNNINYKDIFTLFMENKIWQGYNSGDMAFMVPSYYEPRETRYWVDENGQKWRSMGNIAWYTNLDIQKRHENLILYKTYNKDEYLKYDNYDAIEVSSVKDIPLDYDGAMGVPVTFLDKYNPEQFEILGLSSGRNEFKLWPSKRYISPIQHNPNGTTANGGKTNTGAQICYKEKPLKGVYYTADNADGYLKRVFSRIFIRRIAQ